MKIIIKEISDKKIWEDFLLRQEKTPFFQSWDWGEVQKRSNHALKRLGIYEDDNLKAIAQVVSIKAKRGTFYWIRHGPIPSNINWFMFDHLIEYLKTRATSENVSFIRMAPLLDNSKEIIDAFKKRGFRSAPIHNMDAECAWKIRLDTPEDELLHQMRKTTRYLIRKAEKLGVIVEQTSKAEKLQSFMKLYNDTARRQGFVSHQGIKEEYEIFGEKNLLRLFLAYYHKKLISAAMIIFYGKEAVYHHSGMLEEAKDIPASYLIQWEAIKEAKRRGMEYYNLWGVAPEDKPNHPWWGLRIFKTGFGGRAHIHLHAQDLPLSPRYWVTWLIETTRRIKRGY